MNHPLIASINAGIDTKMALVNHSPAKYFVKAMFAGLYLTLAGVLSLVVSNQFAAEAPHWGKFLNALVFGIGLVVIIFMQAELATSNMMYLTSGVIQKKITFTQGVKVLTLCTLGNLVGSLVTAFLLANSSPFIAIAPDAYLFSAVSTKAGKALLVLLVDGILANVVVNIAVMGQMQLKNEMARLVYIVIALFVFVYFGFEHVIANFGSFSLAYFLNGSEVIGLTLPHILYCWIVIFFANYIGGGLLMGAVHTWLLTEREN